MAEARFDLVILHHTSDKSVEDLVQELLQLLGKAGDPYLEYKLSEALLFEQSTSAILDGIELSEGERYQEKFRQLNVETELRPTLQLVEKEQPANDEEVEQYVCPACQHTQAKVTGEDAMNTCNRCGVVGEKLARVKRKKDVFSTEKRKLAQTQDKEMKEAAVRARSEDEAAMRKEAQEKLGIREKKNITGVLVGTGVAAAMGIASFFIITTLFNDGEEVPAETTIASSDSPDNPQNDPSGANEQPVINIQAGDGSIVINSSKEPDIKNSGTSTSGTSGSKGSTGEVIPENGNSATMAENQQASHTTAQTSQPGTMASAQENTTGSHTTQSSLTDTHLTDSAASTDTAGSAEQNAPQAAGSTETEAVMSAGTPEKQQLAALSKKTTQGSLVKQHKTGAASTSSHLSKITTPPNELDKLSTILSNTHEPEYFFNKLDKQQFAEHQARLQRLLNLGKPELALIFAESMEDPYPASLMVVEIAKHEAKTKSTKLYADLLLSMKALASQGSTPPQKAMLNASLGQVYDFAGDKDSAQSLLKQSVALLEKKGISLAERCKLLAQLELNHRKSGNSEGADFIAETIVNFVAGLSEKEYVYTTRAYAHLAAASLTENNQSEAKDWLNQIPVADARQYLLAQMTSISAAAGNAAN